MPREWPDQKCQPQVGIHRRICIELVEYLFTTAMGSLYSADWYRNTRIPMLIRHAIPNSYWDGSPIASDISRLWSELVSTRHPVVQSGRNLAPHRPHRCPKRWPIWPNIFDTAPINALIDSLRSCRAPAEYPTGFESADGDTRQAACSEPRGFRLHAGNCLSQ